MAGVASQQADGPQGQRALTTGQTRGLWPWCSWCLVPSPSFPLGPQVSLGSETQQPGASALCPQRGWCRPRADTLLIL